jgi:hypothetical protein
LVDELNDATTLSSLIKSVGQQKQVLGGIIEAQQALEAEDQRIAREHEEAIQFAATVEAKNKAVEAERKRLEVKEEERRRRAEKAEEERIAEIGGNWRRRKRIRMMLKRRNMRKWKEEKEKEEAEKKKKKEKEEE